MDEKALRTKALDRSARQLEGDEELRRVAPSPGARARLLAEGTSSLRYLRLACELYADRPCFGERAYVVEGGAVRPQPALRTLTYAGLWRRVEALAAALRAGEVLREGAFAGICGFASVDWVVAYFACLYLAAVSVPLPTAATSAEIRPIVRETSLTCILCSLAQMEKVAAVLAGAPSVRSVVVMDLHEDVPGEAEAYALGRRRIEEERGAAVSVWTMAELERAGRERGPSPPVEDVADETLRTLVYTSGSTGTPKGAMYSERLMATLCRAPWPGELEEVPHVSVDYMPLNHIAGLGGVLRSMAAGGLLGFVRAADMSTLFDDIRVVRPTSLFLVPRAASLIHESFQSELVRRPGAEEEILAEMRRSFLGDRLVYLFTGAAPTAPAVTEFLSRCFEVPVFDGYGSTEAGVIAVDGRIVADNVTDYKLVDVPELGYRGSDQPFPRGELCVRVRRGVPGYFRNPEATADLFDDEGYQRTGDVVELRAPGQIRWIDRKKNVLKLAQGEFVSPSRLEELYASGSPFIHQVYVHGSSLSPFLLAVVVPAAGADKPALAAEIRRTAAREGLRGYEIPRDILVEPTPFTRENGLLTESNKPARARLRVRYGEALERLGEAIARSQLAELHALERERGRERPASEKVARALAVTLGIEDLDAEALDQSFVSLGGDSLGASRLSALLEVPVATILDPTSTIRGLARALEDRLAPSPAAPRPSFAAIHGAGATTISAADLRLDRFLSPAEIVPAEPPEGPPRVVLLTGANGFLGRFLLLELLARLPEGGKVVAVVRAPRASDEAARERLAAAYGGVDPTLPARFAALAGQGDGARLEVLAGDLTAPRLGLSAERWQKLGGEVDVIVHGGALVNHAFSYAELFEPNVLGTAEVIRLALLRRRAQVAFVSSVGVAAGLDRDSPVREDEDAAALGTTRPIGGGYAVGYGTSKWAGEVLLRDLEAHTGIPVVVLRCSSILPPRSFIGQVNAGDFVTRLLHGLVVTGLAPRSFYAPGVAHPRFDGLPVDFVAASIAAVSLDPRAGWQNCHVVAGSRSDGVSLDTLADWVAQAGYPVTRIGDHAAWLRAFRERLEALSPAEQQRSALPILGAWREPARRVVAFDNRCLRERLAGLTRGEPPEIPRIDALFVRQYLKNMVYAGLIGHPGLSAVA